MTLLNQSAQHHPSIPLDSINYCVSLIQGMPTYLSTDRVYNNLLGSGDFKIISNRELKNQIAEYYQAVDLIKVVQNTHEMQLVNSYQPYILDHMDFQAIQGEMFDELEKLSCSSIMERPTKRISPRTPATNLKSLSQQRN